ncbi:RsmB/NOP family class I SAM-dependent RNA methyltransferase [Pacificibacter marinus]|uniref:Ribosomal RNA small subunit methyltransferase B n=1 Tax=Pacificibacter marinus TaxID=658057 RepID=A0A1Y5SUL0_9RHOB|nr:RsmB/NOP family class I SAM-dependent RNA methyltransferase [Pacificibacter marinus]SEK83855.1 16S rRNA (cytosine967-C5)-methyltransferase [Pacificibacter marinus]SLN48801.1 Ribosomal RNA small subunit methyltransferase B [Pacificibacter marinus]
MTPVARISAAIEILDQVMAGEAAERVLTSWGRGHRFAGSKDRAAIRDHVFDALRCLRSYAWLGGAGGRIADGDDGPAPTGRQLMIGALRSTDTDLGTVFNEDRFAPAPLSTEELDLPDLAQAPRAVQLDCPDWILPLYDAVLGDDTDAVLACTQRRAPVFLRVNSNKATLTQAQDALGVDAIEAITHPLSPCALEVTQGARAVARSQAYLTGVVELQDAGSQAIIDALPLADGMHVLDYCAGGGGKSLAMAAKADLSITAHDIDPARMQDIAPRASRAGVQIKTARMNDLEANYDLVLCDAPCSGSGSWARAPQAKWLLQDTRLQDLTQLQAHILDESVPRVRSGGSLVYATCSLFAVENTDQVAAFLTRHPEFSLKMDRLITPLDGGDGFYVAVFTKNS